MGVICSCLGTPFIVAMLLIALGDTKTREQQNAILLLILGTVVVGVMTFFGTG